jgi:quinoprotein glucose dehydrogenase
MLNRSGLGTRLRNKSSMAKPLAAWAVVALALPFSSAQQDHKTWSDYGSGPDSSKYVAFDQITKSNVGRLAVAWTYPTRDSNPYLFNPIVVGDVMYVLARNNSLVALNAETGKEIWIHEGLYGIGTRGINYWESKDHKDRRLIFQINHYIEEIDASTGLSILTFGENGLVDLREGLGRDPNSVARIKSDTPGRVFEDLIILGSSTGENYLAPPGDLRAYNVLTGKMEWIFHTVPHPGEFGYDTWPKDAWKYAGGTNTWGEISVDDQRGIAYFPTGSSTYDMYGGDRIGKDLFADCLIALNARTGKLLWYFQMVHHDLWDLDATSAPQLVTIRHDGKMVDVVVDAPKDGYLYVFDRVTGRPIWPIEEHPFPRSDVPGEEAWPTQPIPTAPPPLARQKLTMADLDPYYLTSEERAQWKERLANANNEGLFTPPSITKETVGIPGARGGSNWGGTASDPDKGMVYLLSQDWPSIFPRVGPQENPSAASNRRGGTGQITFQQYCQGCHGVDRMGSSIAPSLLGIGSQLSTVEFGQLLAAGRGDMPAFPALASADVTALYTFLVNPSGRPGGAAPISATPLGGPVVASGGAPGGLTLTYGSAEEAARYGGRFAGAPYPPGVIAPRRLYSDYGLDFPFLISPPWSQLIAYDLNQGTIRWKVPLGEDPEAEKQGGKDTGILRGGERRGIVVTSTGLLFVNTKDGKIRAYDADTGKCLWAASLPAGTEGLPAMYEAHGRQYLVVPAAAPQAFGRQQYGVPGASTAGRAYVTFALPKEPNQTY